jgi:hypothetical protein
LDDYAGVIHYFSPKEMDKAILIGN